MVIRARFGLINSAVTAGFKSNLWLGNTLLRNPLHNSKSNTYKRNQLSQVLLKGPRRFLRSPIHLPRVPYHGRRLPTRFRPIFSPPKPAACARYYSKFVLERTAFAHENRCRQSTSNTARYNRRGVNFNDNGVVVGALFETLHDTHDTVPKKSARVAGRSDYLGLFASPSIVSNYPQWQLVIVLNPFSYSEFDKNRVSVERCQTLRFNDIANSEEVVHV